MRSRTNERFRKAFDSLPEEIRFKAREACSRWHENPAHPSLQFKKVHDTQPVYSVRVTLGWRAVTSKNGDSPHLSSEKYGGQDEAENQD